LLGMTDTAVLVAHSVLGGADPAVVGDRPL